MSGTSLTPPAVSPPLSLPPAPIWARDNEKTTIGPPPGGTYDDDEDQTVWIDTENALYAAEEAQLLRTMEPVDLTMSVAQFKQMVDTELYTPHFHPRKKEGINEVRLMFKGVRLVDTFTLQYYGLKDGDCLRLLDSS